MAWWLVFWKAARLCELLSRHQRTSAGSRRPRRIDGQADGVPVRIDGRDDGDTGGEAAKGVAQVRLSDWA